MKKFFDSWTFSQISISLRKTATKEGWGKNDDVENTNHSPTRKTFCNWVEFNRFGHVPIYMTMRDDGECRAHYKPFLAFTHHLDNIIVSIGSCTATSISTTLEYIGVHHGRWIEVAWLDGMNIEQSTRWTVWGKWR